MKARRSPLGILKLKQDRWQHKEQTNSPQNILHSTFVYVYLCIQMFVWMEVTDEQSHMNIRHSLDCFSSLVPHFFLIEKNTCVSAHRYSSECTSSYSSVHHLPVSFMGERGADVLSLHLCFPTPLTYAGFQPGSNTQQSQFISSLQHHYSNNRRL